MTGQIPARFQTAFFKTTFASFESSQPRQPVRSQTEIFRRSRRPRLGRYYYDLLLLKDVDRGRSARRVSGPSSGGGPRLASCDTTPVLTATSFPPLKRPPMMVLASTRV